MLKRIRQAAERPLYPYLYGLVIIIYKSVQYTPSFSFVTALAVFLLYCLLTWLLLQLFRASGNPAYPGIPVVLCWAALWHVAGMAQLLGYHYAYIPFRFYVWFYLLVILLAWAGNWLLSRCSLQRSLSFNKVFNGFLLICSTVISVHGIFAHTWEKQNIQEPLHTRYQDTQKQNDIVWILMDEYASSGVLHDQLGFNNPLDSALRLRHFYLLDKVKTRFNNTLLSLNALFNMDDSRQLNYYAGVQQLKQSKWVPLLEASGFRFVNLSFFDIASQPKLANHSGYPQTYLDQLIAGTLFSMVDARIRYSLVNCDKYNRLVYDRLNRALATPSVQPRFIWAHLKLPHEPFCRDRHGQLLAEKEHTDNDSAYMRDNYIGYLEYGNSLLLRLLDEHPNLADKIVVISGDHGPRYAFLHDKAVAYHPFAAIHMPAAFDTAALQRIQYISQIPGFLLTASHPPTPAPPTLSHQK
ncbi:MAG: hypothetical protein NVS3B15_15740 [Sediminibacterium sp.]